MGITRTLIAWLVVLGLQLTPHVTYAEDGGPGREVRAIRHDLPIILASRYEPDVVVVDDVAVATDRALVQAHTSDGPVVFTMTRRLGTWWYENAISVDASSARACWRGIGDASDSNGVTPQLLIRLGMPRTLVDLAQRILPLVAGATKRAATQTGTAEYPLIFHCDFFTERLPFSERGISSAGPYEVTTTFAPNDASSDSYFESVAGRPPTEGESWLARCGNGYAFFSGTLHAYSIVHVTEGTQLDLWFPFALDRTKTYSLTIGHTTPILGPVNGTLKDNTLHFVLPAFAVEHDAEIMGEIDGNSYEC